MKKSLLFLVAVSGSCIFAGENLISNPDLALPKKQSWYCNTTTIQPDKDATGKAVVTVVGLEEPKATQRLIQVLPKLDPEKYAGNSFTFSVKVKQTRLSGAMTFAVREISADGKKTILYNEIKLPKNETYDWKTYTKTFTPSPQTAALSIHVTADYLPKGDELQYTDLTLTMNEK